VSGLFSVVFLQILFKYGGTTFEVHSGRTVSYEPLFVFIRRQKSEIYRRNRRFTKHLLSRRFLSFHDNARPHSAAATIEARRRLTFGFSQIPKLAPTDYHMFGSLKEALRGQRFASGDDKVKGAL
jgi:hypothetical protein